MVTCLCDVAMVLFACLLSLLLKIPEGAPPIIFNHVITYLLVASLSTVVVYMLCNLYSSRRFRPFSREVERIFLANFIVLIIVFASLFLMHMDYISRSMLIFAFGVSCLLISLERYIWRRIINCYHARGVGLHKLLLVGSNE